LAIMRALSKTPALDLPELAGLDQPSLFDTQPVPTGEPLTVPIDRLDQDPNNPRTEFPQQAIDELAQDIAQQGILQPIVVSAADEGGRYSIRFGSKRWRAARQAGLTEVPVVLATRAHDAYDQVAENLKRHGLSPLELARFIGGRAEAGDSNATIAKRLSIDETTVAHHLTLLALPPVLDIALQTGRCTSPRTLYELTKLHANQPERVTELVTGSEPITRGAVAQIRDAALLDPSAMGPSTLTQPRSDRAAQFLSNANRLCERLDAALLRLSRTGVAAYSTNDMATLRQRVAALASRLAT
jgi:ParB family transcriptional regulator, chromosome partitioning protein